MFAWKVTATKAPFTLVNNAQRDMRIQKRKIVRTHLRWKTGLPKDRHEIKESAGNLCNLWVHCHENWSISRNKLELKYLFLFHKKNALKQWQC